MENISRLEQEIAEILVISLNLDDIDPKDINPELPLFGEGLGLDSIDALEMAMALNMRYGTLLKIDDNNNYKIFSSVRSLSSYIEKHRTN